MGKGDFCKIYGEASARERAELIYANYRTFPGKIEDCKASLIYSIKAEKQRYRSNHKDETGIRVQTSVGNSDPTGDEATFNVTLEEQLESNRMLDLRGIDAAEQDIFRRRHRVIAMMRDEYTAFDRHLYSLSIDEQKIIIPVLTHTKDYFSIAEERCIAVESVRKRVSRIHKDIIDYFGEIFIEKL